MQLKRFTVLSLTLAGVLSVQGLFADTTGRWNDSSTGEIAVSQNLQWKRLPAKDARPVRSVVRQVQYQEPVLPPKPATTPLTPAQRDTIYPELRPQSKTVPGGATLEPTLAPTAVSEPKEQKPVEPPKANNRYTDSATQPIAKPAEKPAEKAFATTPVPVPIPAAPQPAQETAAKTKTGTGIPCPDEAGFKSIRDISVDIRPSSGALPEECPLITTSYTGRHFVRTCFQWKASAVCTKAAYFEDVQLERYGHSICPVLQPVISGAKFFAAVPLLPYKMGITPPNECVYTLGHYRVGNCSPYMLDPFPISVRAIAFEAAAVGGAVAVIP
ncbi:MAG: hypothetical protein LBN39_05230 [Planctomycetaceae bacterium]|jgi:hypothetical protein|nr:hypothetical protein [Planctomycetaceae bacterium]